MSSETRNPAHLANLPYELLHQIISHLCILSPSRPFYNTSPGVLAHHPVSARDRAAYRRLRLVCRSLNAAVTNKYTLTAYFPSYASLFTNIATSGRLFKNVQHGVMSCSVRSLTIAEKTGGEGVDAKESIVALRRLGYLRELETVLFTCNSSAKRFPAGKKDADSDDEEGFGESYINNVLKLATPGLSKIDRLTRLWLCEFEPDAYPACETTHWHELLSHLMVLKLDCNTTNDTPSLLQRYGITPKGKVEKFTTQFRNHWGPHLSSLKDFSISTSPSTSDRFNSMFLFPFRTPCPLRQGKMNGLFFSNVIITRNLLSFITSQKHLKRLRIDCCSLSPDLTWAEVFNVCTVELTELCYFRPLLKHQIFDTTGILSPTKRVKTKADYWWTLMQMVEKNAVMERQRYADMQKKMDEEGKRYGTRMRWDKTLEAYISYFEGSPDFFIFE